MSYNKYIKIIMKLTLYMGLLLYSIFSVYNYSKTDNNQFIIKNIIIEGTNYLNKDDLVVLINLNNNKSIFQYNINKVKQTLEKNPFIKTAYISLENSTTLHVEIIERVPIALVLYDNNQVFIDYDNCSLPIDSKSVNNFPVPVLNIKTNNTNFDGKEIGVSLIKHLFTNYNSMYNNVSELLISSSLITLTTDDKTKIFIHPKMVIENVSKLKKFESSIKNIKEIDDYKYINLIYKNQIVVKEKKYI